MNLSRCQFTSKHFGFRRAYHISCVLCDAAKQKNVDRSANNWNTIPNYITMTRIAASPLLSYAIYMDMKYEALIGCFLCGFTDWLDGYIAKNFNMQSAVGAFLDPIADKVTIAACAAGLTAKGLLPVPLMATILLRDGLILTGGLYLRYKDKRPTDRFFDLDTFNFQAKPSLISKVNTGIQFGLLAATLYKYTVDGDIILLNFDEGVSMWTTALTGLHNGIIYSVEPLWYVTGASTLLSGLGYLDGSGLKNQVKNQVRARVDKLDQSDLKARVTATMDNFDQLELKAKDNIDMLESRAKDNIEILELKAKETISKLDQSLNNLPKR